MHARGMLGPRASERGATLIFTALALFTLLAVMGLAIDLGLLYVARNEAQRAADSAALAGATTFMTSDCTMSGDCTVDEPAAIEQAEVVGDANRILGRQVAINGDDFTFTYPSPLEPQITVVVSAVIPTFFMKIFGIESERVSAEATAEAFNPTGSSSAFTPACIVPFLVPNCDTNPQDREVSQPNPSCPGPASYFVNDATGDAEASGVYPNGSIGAQWALHFGSGPSASAGPSQWYLIAFGGSQSGAQLRKNIEDCVPPGTYSCNGKLQTMNGKKVGPVIQGVERLIGASGQGLHQGQDSIEVLQLTDGLPQFQITGGFNNPDKNLRGRVWYGGPSNSIVSVPIYDCQNCGPGSDRLPPGGTTVTVVGFMQIFITDVEHGGQNNPVNAIIMGYYGCGASTSPPPAGVVSGSFIPIRLIQGPG